MHASLAASRLEIGSNQGGQRKENKREPEPKPINMNGKKVVREYSLADAAYHMSSPERSMLIDYFLPIVQSSQDMGHGDRGLSLGAFPFRNDARQPNSNVAYAVAPNKLLPQKGGDQVSSRAAKRPRLSPELEDESESCTIWSYQVDMWQARLEELVEYRKNHGHCRVPHKWKENVALAQWVKR
jgi:hypothetical protein